jgi:hypothetical protein
MSAALLVGAPGTAVAAGDGQGTVDIAVISAELPQHEFRGGTATIKMVSKAPRVGQTLTASVKGVEPKPDSYKYAWFRDGEQIKGATSKTYKLTEEDVGVRLTVKATATSNGFRNRVLKSAQTPVIRKKTAMAMEPDAALFEQIAGTYTRVSLNGQVYAELNIQKDGSFTYVEDAMDDYSNSLPAGFKCPTIACYYEATQLGRLGAVEANEDGTYELQVLDVGSYTTPGNVLIDSPRNGSLAGIAPIVPFATGQKLVVEPTAGTPVPAPLQAAACESYTGICKAGKWRGWTVDYFHQIKG